MAAGVWAMLDTAPLEGQPIVGPSGTSHSGRGRACGGTPRWASALRREPSSNGASTRASWPAASSSARSASM
jgi:hypothetical protein